jgi:hypothetical protein
MSRTLYRIINTPKGVLNITVDNLHKVVDGSNENNSANCVLVINKIQVNKKNRNPFNPNEIEVGDFIEGEIPEVSGRYVKADVVSLPYTDDENLEIYSIDEKN